MDEWEIKMWNLLSPTRSACALVAGAILFAGAAQAQEGLRTAEIDATLALSDAELTVSQEIDVNFDGASDFVIKITRDEELAREEAPLSGDSFQEFDEAAYILALNEDNPFSNSVFIGGSSRGNFREAALFALDDEIGADLKGTANGQSASSAILYQSGFSKGSFGTLGPFSFTDATGFIGFSSFADDSKDPNFGFLEITRGSITIGELGFQQTAGAGAVIGASATVPLPAPLALLGFGVAALFGLRRFKSA